MRLFARLYHELDTTTRTSEKVAALERYFREAPARDAAWALWLLSGRRMKRSVSSTSLFRWATEVTGLPEWLVAECYATVGDGSETIALLIPPPAERTDPPALHRLIEERIVPLAKLDEEGKKALVLRTWSELEARERFLLHKMLSGTYRVGAAAKLVARGLANVVGIDPAVMAHRLTGDWKPRVADYEAITGSGETAADPGRPYPFFLASPLQDDVGSLGERNEWQAEWKWDGIRAQLVRRAGKTLVWSRGEELITESFPEVRGLGDMLPDGTVLDGEVLAWERERALPFSSLQRRLNRKKVEVTLFGDEVPVVFMAYDVLEHAGVDVRERPLTDRREMLSEIGSMLRGERAWRVSEALDVASWEAVAALQKSARERGVEGVMLKRLASAYGVGRKVGDWWKWKVDPLVIDAVLIYAQSGSGRRASLYTDYTFGVWDGETLVPVAKAYSGLTDEEIGRVDAFIRRHTLDRRGPLRVVKPELVFELAFEGIAESERHRSGIALRFPRMSRWREDKVAAEADTLEAVRGILREQERLR